MLKPTSVVNDDQSFDSIRIRDKYLQREMKGAKG